MEAATIDRGRARAVVSTMIPRPADAASRRLETGGPGSAGLGAFAMTTFVLSMFNPTSSTKRACPWCSAWPWCTAGIVQLLAGMWEFRTGNTSARSRSARSAASGSRSGAERVLCQADRRQRGARGRRLPVGVGDLHQLHGGRGAAHERAVLLVFVLLAATFILLAIGADGAHERSRTGAAISASRRRLPRGTHRLRRW